MQPENESFPPSSYSLHSGFDVDVNEAVQLLGVSRTRLSQLVSKGVLGFERRRVDTRLRMFLSRTELLSYLRRQMAGASAKAKQSEWIFDAAEMTPAPLSEAFALSQPPPTPLTEEGYAFGRQYVSYKKHDSAPGQRYAVSALKASAWAAKLSEKTNQQKSQELQTIKNDFQEALRGIEKRFHQLASPKTANKPFVSARLSGVLNQEVPVTSVKVSPKKQKRRTLAKRQERRLSI